MRHRHVELTGRGYDLRRGLRPDPGYPLEPGDPGGGGLADGAVAGRLDGAQPEPALGGLLEPGQRKRGQLLADHVVSRRFVGGPGCAEPDGWGRACLGNAGPQRPGPGDDAAGRRARLARVVRRRLDVGELAGCHAGTSPRPNHEAQGRLTLAASKGRSPMSPNAPRT